MDREWPSKLFKTASTNKRKLITLGLVAGGVGLKFISQRQALNALRAMEQFEQAINADLVITTQESAWALEFVGKLRAGPMSLLARQFGDLSYRSGVGLWMMGMGEEARGAIRARLRRS